MTYSRKRLETACTAGLLLGLGACLLAAPAGCLLVGIEPDEIDVADDDIGDTGENNDTGGSEGADTSAETGTTGDTDDGADDTTGSAETTTDGGESTGTDTGPSTSDTSDSTSGDGTSDTGVEASCEELSFENVLATGNNLVTITDAPSLLSNDCGGAGPEYVGMFVAATAGPHDFRLDVPFDGVLSLVGVDCVDLGPGCVVAGDTISVDLAMDEVVYVVVDSNAGAADANLVITGP